ncbi:hypothetical protein LJR034_005869 [Caballeronia sp. LjRoot34]|uniref:hypothetical protein n=1 Tax=Caballeronia sp. LjRoot34 TaxID=3342325 RepID=UPI003ECFA734
MAISVVPATKTNANAPELGKRRLADFLQVLLAEPVKNNRIMARNKDEGSRSCAGIMPALPPRQGQLAPYFRRN